MATVQAILNKKGEFVATITRDETVLDAARAMNDRRIGAVVVVEGERVTGIFTERDILMRVVAAERNPAQTRVGEVMTEPVACCRPSTPIEECRSVMTTQRIRHLPVVEDGRLCGVVTSGDIMAHEAIESQETIDHLNQYMYNYK